MHKSAEPLAPCLRESLKMHEMLICMCAVSKMADCTMQEMVYLCNGAVSERSTQIF